MGKPQQKTVAEQLEDIVPGTAGENVAAAAVGADTASAEAEAFRVYDESAVLTADLIGQRMKAAMELVQLAFTDQEVRVKGNNGRLYRTSVQEQNGVQTRTATSLPNGVEFEIGPDGEPEYVTVNRLEWKANDMLSAIVNKCERALDNEEARIEVQKAELAKTLRLLDSGRKTQGNVDYETNKLEAMIAQAAVTLSAFRAAYAAYAELTGIEYETKAMRQARERLEQTGPRQAPAGDPRIAALLKHNVRG